MRLARPNAHLGLGARLDLGAAGDGSWRQTQPIHQRSDIHRRFGGNLNQPACTDCSESRTRRECLNFLSSRPLIVQVPWMTTAGEEATDRRSGAHLATSDHAKAHLETKPRYLYSARILATGG